MRLPPYAARKPVFWCHQAGLSCFGLTQIMPGQLGRVGFRCLLLACLVLSSGCTTQRAPENEAISRVDTSAGYRAPRHWQVLGDSGNTVLLAFSGGGVRAAALSYGVMQELRDTLLVNGETSVSVLDDVDVISAVSGGSFTAAYYGLYRERLFEDFEKDFLRLGVQQALIRQLFNPMHWIRSGFMGFNRTEMTIDYYNRIMFAGATFNDLAERGPPLVVINATDLAGGTRVPFTQGFFDILCTDLGTYPLARAVTASSAVPIAFPPVVLENHAGNCGFSDTFAAKQLAAIEAQSTVQQGLLEGIKSYSDAQRRKYIHLVDGGIGDNLGLRSLIDRVEAVNLQDMGALADSQVRNILVILVNAEVKPDLLIEQSYSSPSVSTTMAAVSSTQFSNYNRETLDRLSQRLAQIERHAEEHELPTRVYFSQVSFEHIKSREINRVLNSMPTTLALEDIDVDRLIVAGRLILRNEPAFQAFKTRNHARLTEDALSEEVLCDYYEHPTCNR